jgi:formylglycine-generating enzyme required for sulfatase activity
MKKVALFAALGLATLLYMECGRNPADSISAPVITQQPLSQTVDVGQSVTFTVTATGNPAPAYQWRKNGTNISETSDSFTISSAQLTDAGTYRVVVSNSEGNDTSNGAALAVWTLAPAVLRYISGGTFQMGDTNTSIPDKQPVHSVTVSAFYMDTTEVTQLDYNALMGVNPSFFTGDPQRPVESMTWFDLVLYCNARSKRDLQDTVYTFTSITGKPGNGCSDLGGLAVDFTKNGYRLPTEAEWEYACRAGSTTDYYWGTTIDNNYGWYDSDFSDTTHPVATKLPNAWGLYDMSGNVWEWCNDWYSSSYYSVSPSTDPAGPSAGINRVSRGGSWIDPGINFTSARRNCISPASQLRVSGFRCVRR